MKPENLLMGLGDKVKEGLIAEIAEILRATLWTLSSLSSPILNVAENITAKLSAMKYLKLSTSH